MRTYDEAFEAAKDEPAFSNGTEGYSWMANWCATCTHDRSARDEQRYPPDPANKGLLGCPLLAVSMRSRTPLEWTEKPWQQIKGRPDGETAPALGDTYHCVAYVHDPDTDEDGGGDDDGPPPEPDPPPVCEGQVDMFEVFADQIVEHVESAVLA